MDKGVRVAVGVLWALVPLLTLGLATPLSFGYAAARRRTVPYWAAAVVYLALVIAAFASSGSASGSTGRAVFTVVLLVSWFGGTFHAFVIRNRVFAPRSRLQDAVQLAEHRRELRRQARQVAADPAMAWELRIGRPDLPRQYDDGGLVDVNHASPQALGSLPGMTPELVERVARVREQCGGFSSVEEMSALADLPPALTAQLGEYTLFLP